MGHSIESFEPKRKTPSSTFWCMKCWRGSVPLAGCLAISIPATKPQQCGYSIYCGFMVAHPPYIEKVSILILEQAQHDGGDTEDKVRPDRKAAAFRGEHARRHAADRCLR